MSKEKIEIDWDKYYELTRALPQVVIGDKKGLGRLATAKRAFEKYMDIMTGPIGKAETTEAAAVAKERKVVGKTYPCEVDRETLEKYLLEGQRMVLLSDEEYYKLDSEFLVEHGIVKKPKT